MEGIKNFFRNLVMREAEDEMEDDAAFADEEREAAEIYEFESLKKNRDKNKRKKEFSLHSGTASIVMFNVKEFNDAQEICDSLKEGKAVIVNFEDVDEVTARRIKDIAYGTCYAIEGELRLSTKNVLVIAPEHFTLEGDKDGDLTYRDGKYPWTAAAGK